MLTNINTQIRKDTWNSIKESLCSFIKTKSGNFSLRKINKDFKLIKNIKDKKSSDIWEGINELAKISDL
jgi:hypothetical protein